MRGIVDRLRQPAYPHLDEMEAPAGQLLIDAADEIERLRARVEELEGIKKDMKELQGALAEEIDRLRADQERRIERARRYMNRIGELKKGDLC